MQIKKKRTAHPTFHRNVREEIQLEANSPKRWGETLLGPSAGCLFKFYGPYLSRLTIAFSGLWGQKYSILGKGWIVRPAVSRNKDKFVDPMSWREGVVAGGWVYGMPRGWGGDTFTISRDSLSDREKRRGEEREEERDPALRGSRNDERARRRFANRKTATRYIGEFTYSLSRSFLPPYIYIHFVLLPSACACATVLEEGILSLSRFWKLREKKKGKLFIFYSTILVIVKIFFSFNPLHPWADQRVFFFFIYLSCFYSVWNIYKL